MTMIVQSDTYRVPDGSYAVGYLLTFEPKTGLYTVSLLMNGMEVERAYFDGGSKAQQYAADWTLRYWLSPVDPITEFPATFACEDRNETPVAPCGKFTLHDTQPTDEAMQAWLIEAETAGYEEPHLSHDPEKCRCGDCLTYLAGQ